VTDIRAIIMTRNSERYLFCELSPVTGVGVFLQCRNFVMMR